MWRIKLGTLGRRLRVVGGLYVLLSAIACAHSAELVEVRPEWVPYIELAKERTLCTELRNDLYVIDQVLIFHVVSGRCHDAAYSEVLLGSTPDDVLCVHHDSIGGPILRCPVPSYQDMFEVMARHLDQADFGLGHGHSVDQIFPQREPRG